MKSLSIEKTIIKFIDKMHYLENKHVLGCFFYGSCLTGYNTKYSDIDLHIIFDDSNPRRLIRGVTHIGGRKIEYFEKPISDIKASIRNEFNHQDNSPLSIIGNSRIIFDRKGKLARLQRRALRRYSKPLPHLKKDEAKEYVSILNNRMEKMVRLAEFDSPSFDHLYHLTLEKIRKFYHRLNGLPKIPTTKVLRIYTDSEFAKSFGKEDVPEEEFIEMYLDAIMDKDSDTPTKMGKLQAFYDYSIRNVHLNKKEYRIPIKSRNEGFRL